MRPSALKQHIKKGPVKKFSKGEVFHSLDFNEELYVVKSGFCKRYSISELKVKHIESIYGPDYFFPLSPVFKNLFSYDLNQKSNVYVYQAMTDIELHSIKGKELLKILNEKPIFYSDLLYETGRRLKVDIDRLTSNALQNDHKKVIHQLVCMAEEFNELGLIHRKESLQIPVPLLPIDIAEQLNITEEVAAQSLTKLQNQSLIKTKEGIITIPNFDLLRDAYLR